MNDRHRTPAWARRVLKLTGYPLLLVIVVAVVGAPAIALTFTPLGGNLTYVFAGIIPGVLASLTSRRLAAGAVAATALLVLLVEVAKPYPWAAGLLMAGVGLTIGACAVRGWHVIAVNACTWPAVFLIAPVFTAPGLDWADSRTAQILIPASLTLAGGLWTLLLGPLISRRAPHTTLHPQPRRAAWIYGAGLAILLGLTAYAAASWLPGSTAGWVLLTIIVIVRPELADTRHRIWARALGTILGGITAALIALLIPVHGVLLAVGMLAMAAVVAFQLVQVHYAIYAFAITLAIVLLNTPDSNVIPIDTQRVLFTIVGVVAISVLVTATTPFLRRLHGVLPDPTPKAPTS